MTIAFLTLFLGLTSGTVPVELSARPEVTAIELLLDGRTAVRLIQPPWTMQVDLGAALLPHHLVARGLADDDSEMARAEQWVNLPRPPAEVQIVLERPKPGMPLTARLAWQSLTREAPAEVTLRLDGTPLALDTNHRAQLPPPAHGASTHVLSASVRFGYTVARRDLVLGAEYGDEVSTDLTSFAVRVPSGELPPPTQLAGWFTAEGKPLSVSAVESGPAHVIVVREPGAAKRAADLGWPRLPPSRFRLARGTRIRIMGTLAQDYEGQGLRSDLFEGSQEFDPYEIGLAQMVSRIAHAEGDDARTADAVAVAGVQADLGSGPRAVLLLLSGQPTHDSSHYTPAAVRVYLAALHVPLYIWSLDVPTPALRAAWGTVEDVSTRHDVDVTFDHLKEDLDHQRVVLVEGRHLPQAIAVAAGHPLALVGTP